MATPTGVEAPPAPSTPTQPGRTARFLMLVLEGRTLVVLVALIIVFAISVRQLPDHRAT